MKKNILLIGLALSMLTSSFGVFAEEEIMPINAEEEIMLIAEEEETMPISEEGEEPAEIEEVTASSITIEEVEISKEKEYALIYDNSGNKLTADDLTENQKALLFKDGEEEIAVIIVDEEVASAASIDTFTVSETLGEYVDTMNNLAINVSDETVIVDTEENALTKEDIDGKKLMVFYTFATMSIPAQTTPEKIVVLADDEEAAEEEVTVEETNVTYTVKEESIIKDGGLTTLPLREAAEGLGYEVGWDDTLKKITVGTVPMGVNFVLGVNEYNKARMTPFTLEKAPELVIFGDFGVTYVPASFFTEVLGGEIAENEDGTVTLSI